MYYKNFMLHQYYLKMYVYGNYLVGNNNYTATCTNCILHAVGTKAKNIPSNYHNVPSTLNIFNKLLN